jgi:alkylhydroperoxidase family enzyme
MRRFVFAAFAVTVVCACQPASREMTEGELAQDEAEVTQAVFRLQEPRIAPLAESEWSERQRQLLAPRIADDGSVANVFGTGVRDPDAYEAHGHLQTYVYQALPARDREILILRIAWLCQAEYVFAQHRFGGREAGLTDEEIVRITRGPDDPEWSEADAALIRAADELHAYAIILDATYDALAQRYDEMQLMAIVATIGDYNMVSWILNTAGVQLDDGLVGFPEDSGH